MGWDWRTVVLVPVAVAAVGAAAKAVADAIINRFSPTARLKRADKATKTLAPPAAPPAVALPALSVEMMLLARQTESLHLKDELLEAQRALARLRVQLDEAAYARVAERALRIELEETQGALRRLRASHDEAAFEIAQLASALAVEREQRERLLAEMETLRTEGPPADPPPARTSRTRPDPVDPRFAVERLRKKTQGEKDHG
jgi:hypothetical protein